MLYKSDLHIHSSFSDGKFTPKELIKIAEENKLSVISVTDHDNLDGSAEMMKYDGKNGIRVIPGIELSADFNGKEVHILGYFIDFKNKALIEHLKFIKNQRIRRFSKMISKLNDLGVKIQETGLLEKYSSSCSIGRPHLANELVEQGFAKSFNAAFHKFLGDNKPAHVKKENLDFNVILEIIKISGGLSFLAHPSNYFRESSLGIFRKAGINGIESVHPSHTKNQIEKFSKYAAENGLLVCGGSDFHGFHGIDYDNIGNYFITDKEIKEIDKRIN